MKDTLSGNVNQVIRAYDPLDRLTSETVKQGPVASPAIGAPAYDLNGNLTNDGTRSFTWDARNRMTGITGVASFVYDAVDRRLSVTQGATTTAVVYDGYDPGQEQSPVATVTASRANLQIALPFSSGGKRCDSRRLVERSHQLVIEMSKSGPVLRNTAQLRDEIDGGQTGDKVGFPDPAAAPLGTDDEAAGVASGPVPSEVRPAVAGPGIAAKRLRPVGHKVLIFAIAMTVLAMIAVASL